ncbi:unnamed protein product [Notodromas monacha]|uniref:Lipase domain-containing protein n=1 Tax=Notodromas monacha TaxID=399045 RepID=A0A7R9GGA3_9CRUS|nr:unnamed protein product [Notodromas monacha]CAG0921498.1 unnamed protein product [Notodromas monacha]
MGSGGRFINRLFFLLLTGTTFLDVHAGLDGSRIGNFITRSRSLIKILKAEYPAVTSRGQQQEPQHHPHHHHQQQQQQQGLLSLQMDLQTFRTSDAFAGNETYSHGADLSVSDPAELKTFDRDICFTEDLGCFSTQWGPMSHLNTLPVSPEEVDVKYLLYTNESRVSPLIVKTTDVLILMQNTSFKADKPIKFIIHGYMDSGYSGWINDMRDALLDEAEKEIFLNYDSTMNIFAVDWEKGAHFRNYVQSAANSELVGRVLAHFISQLVDNGVKLDDIHIIGFSLGAQVSGHAANWLKHERNDSLVGRITGLEPAAPLFVGRNYPEDTHLDASDAKFVDILHTNGQPLWLGGQGAFIDTGHVDFYPNGGLAQPGCRNLFIGAILDLFTGQDGRNCNHRRAYHYFTESIKSHREKNCRFVSFPCPNLEDFATDFVGSSACFSCGESGCGEMGYFADKAAGRGKQYLLTHGKARTQLSNFCGEMYRLTVYQPETSNDHLPGHLSLTFLEKSAVDNETLGTYTISSKASGASGRNGAKISSIILLPAHHQFDELPALIGFKADGVRQSGSSLASFYLQGLELESEKLHLRYYLCVAAPEPILSGTQVRKLLRTTPCS